jgi:NAD(P)-dependent dehydrogenase (short-subunit alcohol dehydrogenase family)
MSTKRSGTVLITGGTVNLGFHAALNIARARPEYTIVIASRSDGDGAAARINKLLNQDNVVFLPLDLFDKTNIRSFAANWASHSLPPLKALLLNAGLQFPGALEKTADGVEKTFAIQVGNALLFHLLCPYLAAGARIVVTSSGTHDPAQKSGMPDASYTSAEDLAHPPPPMVDIDGRQRYTSTKLANVLWTYAVERQLALKAPERRLAINAFDPGLMPGTGLAREYGAVQRWLWNNVFPKLIPLLRLVYNKNVHTPRESGAALARLAVEEDLEGVSGRYFEGREEIKSSIVSYDEAKQDDIWEWTVSHVAKSGEEKAQFLEFR